ncbi:MAG: hypothetical protein KGZ79_09835 [Dethiobacter sp.]|nr:hypothetical protein [Dethiobacter sp.]
MKRLTVILFLLVLVLLVFAGSAAAFHPPDDAGRTCFRCHSTHSGVSGMLFNQVVNGRDVQSAFGVVTDSTVCLACHDGTGHYISVTGVNNNNMMHSGLFDLTKWPSNRTENFSAHTINIAKDYFVPITSAPGNKNEPQMNNNITTLGCASCHAPHGTFEGVHAYLKPNPNESIDGKFMATYADWGAVLDKKPEAVEITLTRVGPGLYENAASAPWLRTYIMARGAVNTHYVKYPVAVKQGGKWVFNKTVGPNATNFEVNPLTGQVKFATDPGAATLTAKVFQPILVKVTGTYDGQIIDEAGKPATIKDVRIFTNNVNRWCGACHGNYNIRSRIGEPFQEGGNTLHGHNVYRPWAQSYATPMAANGQANCLSCHFAHGTRSDIMLDANKQIVGSRTYADRFGNQVRFIDANPALKRFIGGSVCIICHDASHNTEFSLNAPWRAEQWVK